MKLGYQASKNRLTTTISLDEDQSFRLRRLAASAEEKISPFVGRLIDDEWERRHKAAELEPTGEVQVA